MVGRVVFLKKAVAFFSLVVYPMRRTMTTGFVWRQPVFINSTEGHIMNRKLLATAIGVALAGGMMAAQA
jgi:hypothetical protein